MAAKQLNPCDDEEAKREELLKEVKAMAELQHMNVVRIFGVCMDPGHTCVLMEFASNGTVRDLLDKAKEEGAPLPTYALFGLMRDIILGMRCAHAHEPEPIVHRDLKAANILLSENHTALIADFGLATGSADDMEEEQGGGGTLAYSPPEVLEAMARNDKEDSGWSPAGDVFSFGILAWELVTGEVPYTGITNARDLFKQVVHQSRRCHDGQWDETVDNCDPFLADVIRRCWAQSKDDRPTFEQLSDEFEAMAGQDRFQSPDIAIENLDNIVNPMRHSSSSNRSSLSSSRGSGSGSDTTDFATALKGLEEREQQVKLDVERLLEEEEDKLNNASKLSAIEQAKGENKEAKSMLTDTFANFYSDVFGNNKAAYEDDDLEAMV
jgi:serine/threonine protein kinase